MLIFHYVVGLSFMLVLLVQGIDMVAFTLKMDSHSIAIDFPLVLTHSAVPVGSVILILQFINKLLSVAVEER